MSHVKRISMPKSWPLPRKGTKYLNSIAPGKNKEIAIPLVIVLRDMLKVVKTSKEVEALLYTGDIVVDGKIRKERSYPLSIFDIISIPKLGKNYRIILAETGKIAFEEISAKEAELKSCKVIGKKMLKGKKIQINCFDGRNFLSKEKINLNDSVIFNLKENKVVKVTPLKEGAEAFIIRGEHIGAKGKITEISGEKIKVKIKEGTFETRESNIYLI